MFVQTSLPADRSKENFLSSCLRVELYRQLAEKKTKDKHLINL